MADVELGAGTAALQPTYTPHESAPEGIHAVLWAHGAPVGDMTVPGAPEAVLPKLPELALAAVRRAGVDHLLNARAGSGPPHTREIGNREAAGSRSPDAESVTIAVCTRDRPEYLRDCLASLSAVSQQVSEVLVIDNASGDSRTREVAVEFPFARYVHEPREGIDWARNRALIEARTPIVAFTDDDAVAHPGWITGLLRAFNDEAAAVVVTGPVIPAELATPAQVIFEGHGGFGRGFTRKRFSMSAGPDVDGTALSAGTGAAGVGANMAVLRQQVIDLGGFDVALGVGTPTRGGDDLEMFLRVVAAGNMLVYEPTAVVRHRHRPTMDQLRAQRRGDGTGSYSIFLGAGMRYRTPARRRFVGVAAWWLAKRHLRRSVASLLWPSVWPRTLVYAEARGVLEAGFGRLYRSAVQQARQQALIHSDEPRLPHPIKDAKVRPVRLFSGHARRTKSESAGQFE